MSQYINRLRECRGNLGFVKIIERAFIDGRSVTIEQLIDDLKKTGVSEKDILYIDFDDIKWKTVKNKDDLNAIIERNIPNDHLFYVIFDQIQNVEDWQTSVSVIFKMNNVDLYITDCDSWFLQEFLHKHASGKDLKSEYYDFTFSEFTEMYGYTDEKEAKKEFYVHGGLVGMTRKYDNDGLLIR